MAPHGEPDEAVTDPAQALETVIEELIPDAFHNTEQYRNNRVECDHGRLKARLRPMSGLKTVRGASVVISGHASIQNLRRGHHELGVEARTWPLRVAASFDELATVISFEGTSAAAFPTSPDRSTQQCPLDNITAFVYP